jgi:hypothetical protein
MLQSGLEFAGSDSRIDSADSPGHGFHNSQAVKVEATTETAIATITHPGMPRIIVWLVNGQYQGIPSASKTTNTADGHQRLARFSDNF